MMQKKDEYRLITDQFAAVATKIPASLEISKEIAEKLNLLEIQFNQLKVRDHNLNPIMPFSGFSYGRVTNPQALVESVECYMEIRNNDLSDAMQETFKDEIKASKDLKDPCSYLERMSEILADRSLIVEHHKALGYSAIDRKVFLDCDMHPKLVIDLVESDRNLEAFVDVRQHEDGCYLYYPQSVESEVMKFIRNNEDSLYPRSIEAIPPCIPGWKDIADFHRSAKRKQELKNDSEFGIR